MYQEKEILQMLENLIEIASLKSVRLSLKDNKGTYQSIMIVSEATPYRPACEVLFARICTTGKLPYISFSKKHDRFFKDLDLDYTYSNDFILIALEVFIGKSDAIFEQLSAILRDVFIHSFNFDSFGCCHRYIECSDEKRCTHPDPIYAFACQYKENLDNGKIFYGKNKSTPI